MTRVTDAPAPRTEDAPVAGWYDDPGGTELRWWDGRGWTGTTHLRPQSGGWGAPASPEVPVVARPEVPVVAPSTPPPWWGEPAYRSPPPPAYGSPPAPAVAGGEPVPPAIPTRGAWWALVGLALGEIVGGILVSLVSLITGGSSTSAPVTLAGEVGLWAGMIGSCIFVSRRYGTGSLRRDFTFGFKPVDLGWGPVAAIAAFIATAIASALFVGTRLHGSNSQIITGQKNNRAGFAVVAVIVAVGAPFFEELFFRGLIRVSLRPRLGGVGAVFAQAGVFGLAHYQPTNGLGNVNVVVAIALVGLVLGFTALLTRRLGAGMIGHCLFNVVAVVAVLLS